ncbi:MAG: elongation factor Ts [Chromatiales bacterium]|nr:elongation factor Ts [Chromatiales bacterium]
MQITAAMVKELRERTGAGMMECKKALNEANGDMEAAIEIMRKSGAAKAVKKAGRVAAEGKIAVAMNDAGNQAAIVEVNCETDFVAKDDNFVAFVDEVAACILENNPTNVDALNGTALKDRKSVEEVRQELVAKIGENIQIRRFAIMDVEGGVMASYLHGTRIGVLVALKGGNEDLARDVAMHIAASRPVCLDETGVPQEMLDKEREIIRAQAEESGKPAEIVEKMVEGRIKKYLAEITLVGQPFVKDPDTTVGKLLSGAGAEAVEFVRYEVGEGIEKKQEDFAAEVMAQAKGSQ